MMGSNNRWAKSPFNFDLGGLSEVSRGVQLLYIQISVYLTFRIRLIGSLENQSFNFLNPIFSLHNSFQKFSGFWAQIITTKYFIEIV